jgi:hypothetical protein
MLAFFSLSGYAVVDGIKDSYFFLRGCFSSDVIYILQPIDFRSTQNDAAKFFSLLSIPLSLFLSLLFWNT